MCLLLLLVTALSLSPDETNTGVIVDHVDVVELNHCHSKEGTLCFSQLIFRRWDPWRNTHSVIDYRVLSSHRPIRNTLSIRRIGNDGYECSWMEYRCLRKVITRSFRETRTKYDPEREDRKELPMDRRVGLTKEPPRFQ